MKNEYTKILTRIKMNNYFYTTFHHGLFAEQILFVAYSLTIA